VTGVSIANVIANRTSASAPIVPTTAGISFASARTEGGYRAQSSSSIGGVVATQTLL
jgi:hypothetical protein